MQTWAERQEYIRKWRAAHPDYDKKRYAEKRDEFRLRSRRRWADDPGYWRLWLASHPGYLRALRAANPERARAHERKWRQSHPGVLAAKQSRRRALKAGIPGSHTAAEFDALVLRYGGLCAYCGTAGKMTRDHRIPLIRLDLNPTDYIDNILPACGPCNSRKNFRTEAEFREMLYPETKLIPIRADRG